MTIVLNEHEWARDMIYNSTLGKKPFDTFYRVAKYYMDEGKSKKETRQLLDVFLQRCDPSASLPRWADALDYAVRRATKNDAVDIDFIPVTKPEMDKIRSVESKRAQRLAFTLLCLAKYWDIVNPSGDHWVNTKDSEIMAMANISTSIKAQSSLYAMLNDAGLIRFSKKIDNTNVRVCFMENGETAVKVSNFRNLGYQYMMNDGSNRYIKCQRCGVVVRAKTPPSPDGEARSGRKQKYCADCANEIKIRQNVNSVMRRKNEVV